MARFLSIAVLCTTLVGVPTYGQAGYDRVLVPISVSLVPGAYGTLWSTELWHRNNASVPIRIDPISITDWVPTVQLMHQLPIPQRPPDTPGLFLRVSPPGADHVDFDLRLFNHADPLYGWGTKLPVVRESQFADVVSLINVPTAREHRTALRIYGLPGTAPQQERVRVRIYAPDNQLLAETALPFDAVHVDIPQYAAILSVADEFPQIRNNPRVRIEVTSESGDARLWAFVAVVSNFSQSVVLVTPD